MRVGVDYLYDIPLNKSLWGWRIFSQTKTDTSKFRGFSSISSFIYMATTHLQRLSATHELTPVHYSFLSTLSNPKTNWPSFFRKTLHASEPFFKTPNNSLFGVLQDGSKLKCCLKTKRAEITLTYFWEEISWHNGWFLFCRADEDLLTLTSFPVIHHDFLDVVIDMNGLVHP